MAEASDLENRLRQVEDWIALQRIMGKYRDFADKFDFDNWADLFTEDAVFDQRGTVFADLQGRKAIYERCVEQVVGNWESTQHALANADFDIQGDVAHGVVDMLYTAVPIGAKSKSAYFQAFSLYHIDFLRTKDGWKITRLTGNPIADNSGKSWADVFGQQSSARAS